ncbi:MAG: tetratricopeptide repeat protein [Candidatus Marinimicrobia bacterium]|nr:tetratricopeptide repeat protein [Candidatus Neomarinimicrobiota bacterium]MCF7902450.1 tetratricopeptide repeat protein [Candidatus Neomarinimicrobiota bacterium]
MTRPSEIWYDLRERRFFPILAAYFGGGWVFLEFFGFVVDTLNLSPALKLTALTLLAAFLPTAALIAWFHGRPGKDPVSRTEKIFIPINVVVAVFILLFMPPETLSSTDATDAAVMKVKYEESSGDVTERTLVRPQFQTPIMLYLFQNKTNNPENDWLEFWFVDGLLEDLTQNNYLSFNNQYINQQAIFSLEMEQPSRVPLSIQLKWAQDAGAKYLVNGDFHKEGNLWRTQTRVYRVPQGQVLMDENFIHTNPIDLIDKMSPGVKQAVNLSDKQIRAFPDLPVRELVSYDVEAIKAYSKYWTTTTWGNDPESALRHIKQAVAADPTFALAHFLAWQLCFMLNRPDYVEHLEAAMRFKDRLSDNNRQYVEYNYFQTQGKSEAAEHALNRWIALAPNNPQPYILRANNLAREGRRQEALANLSSVYRMSPENEEALASLSQISLTLGRPEDALKHANQFINDHPGLDRGYVLKGNALRLMGDYSGALHAYEQAYANDPQKISNWIAVARERARQQSLPEVVAQLEEMLETRTAARDKVRIYRLLYELEKDQGHYIEAFKIYRKMMEVGRSVWMPIAYYTNWVPLIQDLARMNLDNEANFIIQTMEKNLRILGEEITALAKFSYYLEKEDADSLETYWQILNSESGFKNMMNRFTVEEDLFAQARICFLRQDYENAKAYLNRLRQASAYNYLVEEAEMRIAMQEYDLAQNSLETRLVMHPKDMKAYYTLADLYLARGETNQARNVVKVLNELIKSADPILPLVAATQELQSRLGMTQTS